MNLLKLASLIDHTNLKSSAVESDIDELCSEAVEHRFASVCVYGYWVDLIRSKHQSGLRISQVVNFPMGLSVSHVQTLSQINSSADEYDIVMNISKLKEKRYDEIEDELKRVRAYIGRKILKVIVESAVLTQDEILTATSLVSDVGADFIKTSTGFIPQPEEKLSEQVASIRNYIRLHHLPIEVKASGGIKSLDHVKALISMGATRIGTSSSVKIMRELKERGR